MGDNNCLKRSIIRLSEFPLFLKITIVRLSHLQRWPRRVGWLLCLVCSCFLEASETIALKSEDYFAGFEHRVWKKADGLADNEIHAITQTHDGYLWLSTRGGLTRFDGLNFRNFNRASNPELISHNFQNFVEDRAGNLWAGTTKKPGAFLLSGNAFRALGAHDFLIGSGRFGGVWFVKGQAIQDPLRDISVPIVVEASIKLFESKDRVVWVGQGDALEKWDPRSRQQAFFRFPDAQRQFAGMTLDGTGRLLVLRSAPTEPIMVLYNGGETNYPVYAEINENNGARGPFLFTDNAGDVWIPYKANTLIRIGEGRFRSVPLPWAESHEFALCMFEDREGRFWIGSESSGLHCFSRKRIERISTEKELPFDNIRTVYQTRDGSIWAGAEGGLVHIQTNSSASYTENEGLSNNSVRALAEDSNGVLWIGTRTGLNSLRDGKITKHPIPFLAGHEYDGALGSNKIRAIYPGRFGDLWLGVPFGLVSIQEGRTNLLHLPYAVYDVTAIIEDDSNNLWFAINGYGLRRISLIGNGDGRSLDTNSMAAFTMRDGLSTDHCWILYQDSEGLIWAGGERGLNCIDHAGSIKSFTTEDGLPENRMNTIIGDDFDNLWIGFDHGICRVSRRELKTGGNGSRKLRIIFYDEVDGLPSSEINGEVSFPSSCKTSDGKLLFATTKGIAVIDPKKILQPEVPPRPVIERVLADGQDLKMVAADVMKLTDFSPRKATANPDQSLLTSAATTLEPGRGRILEFHYTACSFTAPERTRFEYKLEGYEQNWQDAETRRVAYYSNLGPGDYRFQVRAINHHNVKNLSSASFAFSIRPYLWQRASFWLLISGMSACVLYGFYKFRMAHHRQIERLRGELALARERDRIAKDLHDGAGAALTELRLLSALAEQHIRYPDRIKGTVSSIAAAAGRLEKNLREIIWLAHSESQTLEGILSRACEQAEALAAPAGIRCHFDIPANIPKADLSSEDSQNLYFALKEALNNAVKHSKATELRLAASIKNFSVTISVKDNGIGIESTDRRNGQHLGMLTMRERITRIGGHFEMKPENGTQVLFHIPFCL
jgi:signal transduction histidine kinase